jgi:hypothetical protein
LAVDRSHRILDAAIPALMRALPGPWLALCPISIAKAPRPCLWSFEAPNGNPFRVSPCVDAPYGATVDQSPIFLAQAQVRRHEARARNTVGPPTDKPGGASVHAPASVQGFPPSGDQLPRRAGGGWLRPAPSALERAAASDCAANGPAPAARQEPSSGGSIRRPRPRASYSCHPPKSSPHLVVCQPTPLYITIGASRLTEGIGLAQAWVAKP